MKEAKFSTIGCIVATGPSLKDIPLEFLDKYRTYSVNGIFYLDNFIPSHYLCSDVFFLEQNFSAIRILAAKTEAWIRWPYHAKMGYLARPLHRVPEIWSFEPDVVVGLSGSVLYQAMQIAYWHDIMTLLVVGLDHDYFQDSTLPEHFDGRYTESSKGHPQLASAQTDPGYSKRLKTLVERGFETARAVFEKDGRRIINLTEGSQYNGFERGNIDDWS